MRRDFASAQRGFGLVAALFLILVIAGVIAAMARLSVTQHSTSSLAIQQARAYQAAQAGLEWGIYRATNGQVCNTSTNFMALGLEGYGVQVKCDEQDELISLTSLAQYSQPGSPDHVYRQLRVVLEK